MQPTFASRLRMAAVMTLLVYPVVTLYLYVLMPLTAGWEIWQRCLILVPVMATTIVLIVVPAATRYFGGFIAGHKKAAA
jgi:antibiotic biosynthesis monooxygenase (ABM) superfamily enzyme